MSTKPEVTSFQGVDGALGALRWPGIAGAPTVLALHGTAANAWHFDMLAHRLAGSVHLIALDLRGRGRSEQHPGPFGIRQHAADVDAVVRQLNGPVTVVGHSIGAFVAMMAAEQQPGLFHRMVLVDGGTPLTIAPGATVDEATNTWLAPVLKHLRRVWPDRVSYETMWASHPAFSEGLSIDLERNLLADLIETDGGFRVAVNEAAVLIDGRELLADQEIRSLLAIQDQPAIALRATAGPLGAPPPFIPDTGPSDFPQHHWRTIAGTNHFTILLSPRGATAVATAVRDAVAAD